MLVGSMPKLHSSSPKEPAVTPLRQRMLREMRLRSFSPRTIECYLDSMIGLATYYHRSPDQLKLEEIRTCLHYLSLRTQVGPQYLQSAGRRDHFLLSSRPRPGELQPEVSPQAFGQTTGNLQCRRARSTIRSRSQSARSRFLDDNLRCRFASPGDSAPSGAAHSLPAATDPCRARQGLQ